MDLAEARRASLTEWEGFAAEQAASAAEAAEQARCPCGERLTSREGSGREGAEMADTVSISLVQIQLESVDGVRA